MNIPHQTKKSIKGSPYTALTLIALIILGGIWTFWRHEGGDFAGMAALGNKTGGVASVPQGQIAGAEKNQTSRDPNAVWQASPFQIADGKTGSGVLPELAPQNSTAQADKSVQAEPEVISAEEAARRKKMADLGYLLPPEYYSKDLKTLRKMAKAGDAFAMMHIGEKYYFEMNGQTNHPEFESNMDYSNAAKQSFKDALAAGNIRSAGIIAELYFQEKNTAEAYAWHLVSEQLGDSISADWFRRTDMAMQASEAVKQAAAIRAAQILAELNQTKKHS